MLRDDMRVSATLFLALVTTFTSLHQAIGETTGSGASAEGAMTTKTSTPASKQDWKDFKALGVDIRPGTKHRLNSMPLGDFFSMRMAVPVWIARGQQPGKTLVVTAGIHGDELNGVEIARRIFVQTDLQHLAGMLVVLPVLNRWGFLARSRYMSDRRDLNRAFPGDADGSSASIIAHSVFDPEIRKADALVDLHKASDRRINLPQIHTDLSSPPALQLARHIGGAVVLNGSGPKGALRRAALDAGIPSIIYEAGGVYVLQSEEIERGVAGIHNIMRYLEMIPAMSGAPAPLVTVYKKQIGSACHPARRACSSRRAASATKCCAATSWVKSSTRQATSRPRSSRPAMA